MSMLEKGKRNAKFLSRPVLVTEFNVQVFSDGRVEWDNLDRFVRVGPLEPRRLVTRLLGRSRR